jgi:hypothetical protein
MYVCILNDHSLYRRRRRRRRRKKLAEMIGETSYYSHHAHQNGRSSPATLGNNSKHTHGWLEKNSTHFLQRGNSLPPLVVANDHLKKEMKKKKLTAFWAA